MIPLTYNIHVAAEMTGLNVSKIRALIRADKLVARYAGKDILIERAELERFIAALPQERAA